MKLRYGLTVLALSFSHASFAHAQIIWMNKVGDKTVTCMHSGLSSDLKDCGTRSNWYAYVFVGQISAITPSDKDESEIQIRPEEVFLGKPENPMKVLTSQGWCLPKLAAGDRWLFYLRKEDGKPIVLDYYGNDSVPIADAQAEIETLRRLQKIGEFGILQGRVMQGQRFDGKVLPDARVTAIRKGDQRQYLTNAGADGRYEFEPLPPGEYALKVAPVGAHTPDGSEVTMQGGACWDLTLTRSSHARIAGTVKYSNGALASNIDVVLINADNSGYLTMQTNEEGKFKFDTLLPGDYVVGFNFPRSPDWFNGGGGGVALKLPPASWFYPGAPNRADAHTIQVKTDEKLDDISVILPAN